MTPSIRTVSLLVLAAAVAAPAGAAELRGSPGSMRSQHRVALRESFAFSATQWQMRRMIAAGELVPVEGNADYVVDRQVVHRYARPEIRTFLERLGAQYRAATGRPLVVTSLVRPKAEQPRNAHPLSVHPVGMAVDLRIPARKSERAWLERALLAMEQQHLIDATRERRPPHYHVAVFPAEYGAYVARFAPAGRVDAAVTAPSVEALAVSSAVQVATPAAARAEPVRASLEGPVTGGAGAAMFGLGALFVVRRRRRRKDDR